MPTTEPETVDIDAELRRWHDAQSHLDALAHDLDSVTIEHTPETRGRLLAERERHLRAQAEIRERLGAGTA